MAVESLLLFQQNTESISSLVKQKRKSFCNQTVDALSELAPTVRCADRNRYPCWTAATLGPDRRPAASGRRKWDLPLWIRRRTPPAKNRKSAADRSPEL